jgi:hypothetical protein
MLCKHPLLHENKTLQDLASCVRICNINLCVKFIYLLVNAYV